MSKPVRIAAVAVLLLVIAPPALADAVPDLAQHSFPNVVTSRQLESGQAATVLANVAGATLTVDIPAGAISAPVRFEVLAGPLSFFTTAAPAGQEPLTDFAFRVTSLGSGQLIGSFAKPVTITVTDPRLTAQSGYYNFTIAGNCESNPKGLETSPGVVKHPIDTTTVGWVITTPKSDLPGAG